MRGESSPRRLRPSVTPLPLRIRLLRRTALAYAVFYVLRAGGIVYLGLGPSLPWVLGRRTSGTSPGPALAMAGFIQNPRLMNKLQAEVRNTIAKGKVMVTEDELSSLAYL